MSSQQAVSLGSLESDLGLSRVDLLLVMRELSIEPIRRGMRTWIRQEETGRIYDHLGRANPKDPLVAEVVTVETNSTHHELVTTETGTEPRIEDDVRKYSKLRLLRERIEVLDLLKTTQIELTGHDICSLLEIKRLPQTEQLSSGQRGFQRMGLEFERINRAGQRTAWLVKKPTAR